MKHAINVFFCIIKLIDIFPGQLVGPVILYLEKVVLYFIEYLQSIKY